MLQVVEFRVQMRIMGAHYGGAMTSSGRAERSIRFDRNEFTIHLEMLSFDSIRWNISF